MTEFLWHLEAEVDEFAGGVHLFFVQFTTVGGPRPGAGLRAIDSPTAGQQRRLGFMAGQFSVPDDFDRMCGEDITRLFESSK